MFANVIFLLATVLFANVVFQTDAGPPGFVRPNPKGLANLFFTSAAQDPRTALACFTDYILHSNKISETYSQNYKNCLIEAANGRKGLERSMQPIRNSIVNASRDICTAINNCNSIGSTLDLFDCHGNTGSNNTKAAYEISANATEYARTMHEKYRLIDLQHEKCGHAAERAYVEQSSVNYNYLQACLSGHVKPRPPPVTTTSTIAPTTTTTITTTTTTTEAPTTTVTDPPNTEGLQAQFQELLNLLN